MKPGDKVKDFEAQATGDKTIRLSDLKGLSLIHISEPTRPY